MLIELPKVYQPIFEPKRYKVLSGGRGSAKSWAVALYLLSRASTEKLRILCTREIQNSIADSVHKVLCDLINKYSLPNFEMTKSDIRNIATGTEFMFKGLRHNIMEIKSMEGVDIAWQEEAQSLSMESLEILIPTIRKPNSELIFSYNRVEEEDPVHMKFVAIGEDPDIWHVHTTYRDNPFFPEVLIKEMERDKRADVMLYQHVWEGEPRRGKGNLFDLAWFQFLPKANIPKEQDFEFRFVTADTSYKEKETNDYTVFTYWGVLNKKLYLLDAMRKQINAIDVEDWIVPWIKPKVTYGFRYVWIEDNGHGVYLNQKLPSRGIPIPAQDKIKDTLSRRTNKVERANNIIAWINKNDYNIIINSDIDPTTLRDMKQELVFFPNGKNDDFVDTFIDGVKIGLSTKDHAAEMRKLLYG